MTRAVVKAGFLPFTLGPLRVLLRPRFIKIAGVLAVFIVLLLVYGMTHGTLPIPSSAIGRALFYPDALSAQQVFIVRDIRLPRLLMAIFCGAMLGLAGAAMQSITRNGLADPGLIGVKEGASVVVLTLILLFPSLSLAWRPLAGMLGGVAVALFVVVLARDLSRPRFILIGIGVAWAVGGDGAVCYYRGYSRCPNGNDLACRQSACGNVATSGGGRGLGTAGGADTVFDGARCRRGANGQSGCQRARGAVVASDVAAVFCPGAVNRSERLLRGQPWFCWPYGTAHGAISAPRWPGGVAHR